MTESAYETLLESLKPVPHQADTTALGDLHRECLEKSGEICSGVLLNAVRNVKDTSDEKSPLQGGWAGYWKDKVWLDFPKECSNIDCENDEVNPEIVGAHVRQEGEPMTGTDAWIAPLCKKCNSAENKKSMELIWGTMLVRVKMEDSHDTVEEEDATS